MPRDGSAPRPLQVPQSGPATGAAKAPVSVEAIDYGNAGDVSISGKAETGAKVQVYLDNKLVGSSETKEGGTWTVTPPATVEPGTYQLRVDSVAPGGKVTARIELPFQRAAPIRDLPGGRFIVIQPGQNLWTIARNLYGDGVRFTQIVAANRGQIRDPDLIYPGQVFSLPGVN
ncbi:MAG: hypothetical protein OHK0024_27190 [Thalassobaculales bacterium]